MSAKHEFAFYCDIPLRNSGSAVTITDQVLINRIANIVRLKTGQECIIFNASAHAQCVIVDVQKKSIKLEVVTLVSNTILKPTIEVILPLLKREDFESSLYAMVELGATKIQLVHTEKSQRAWGGTKDMDRAHRIMVAAAEQSKNFTLPELCAPLSLASVLDAHKKTHISKMFFDPLGNPVLDVIQTVKAQKSTEVVLLVGPEGDLTEQEKSALKDQEFIFCALTPTVLRAVQAVQLGLGIFRSIFRN